MRCALCRPCRLVGYGLLALGLICLAAGCGVRKGHVFGKVTLTNGKPLPGGTVTFFPQEGKGTPVVAKIKEDGNYDAPGVPVGPVKISVNNSNLDPNASTSITGFNPDVVGRTPSGQRIPTGPPKGMMEKMGPPKEAMQQMPGAEKTKEGGSYVPIEPKFYDPDKSGLTYDVKPGDNNFDITGIVPLGK